MGTEQDRFEYRRRCGRPLPLAPPAATPASRRGLPLPVHYGNERLQRKRSHAGVMYLVTLNKIKESN